MIAKKSLPRKNESDEVTSSTPLDLDTVIKSVQLLIETAAERGRDWKLIDALLITTTAFIADQGSDLLAPPDPEESRRRLRPEFRDRIEAIVDSMSDDEAADFLGIGTRQVRRRAREGTLYFFTVGKRRRYPAWQFNERLGVLPALREIVQIIPEAWPPERVHRFMIGTEKTLEIAGQAITPRTWLALGLDPEEIAHLVREDVELRG